MINENYKLKISIARMKKGLSQNELAKRIGISANYLSELEHNKFDIRFGLLLRIAEELNVKIDELYEKIE